MNRFTQSFAMNHFMLHMKLLYFFMLDHIEAGIAYYSIQIRLKGSLNFKGRSFFPYLDKGRLHHLFGLLFVIQKGVSVATQGLIKSIEYHLKSTLIAISHKDRKSTRLNSSHANI